MDWEIPIKQKQKTVVQSNQSQGSQVQQKQQEQQVNKPISSSKEQKQIAIDYDNLATKVLMRTKNGVYLADYHKLKDIDQKEDLTFVTKENNYSLFTQNGQYLIVVGLNQIIIFDCQKMEIVKQEQKHMIQQIHLSPANKFLTIMQKVEQGKYILELLSLPTLEIIKQYEMSSYKRDSWPLLKMDEKDEISFRMIKENEIEVTDLNTLEIINKISLKFPIDQFYLSPKRQNLVIMCVLTEHFKGFSKTQAKLSIFKYSDLLKPIYEGNMEKSQEIIPYFSPDGTVCLIKTQTMHDETGQSYYGQNLLFHFDLLNNKLKPVNTYEGPIHDVQWNPNSKDFIVISGFMPAASVMFDKNLKPLFEFGKHHKNTLKYSPNSRLLCIGGFGNLNGEIEVWDLQSLKQVGKCKSESAVSCEFSPDGQTIMTGVLNPRLRVDNELRVFLYHGKQIHYVDFSKTELYEVLWQPTEKQFFELQENLGGDMAFEEEKVQEKQKKFFRPPGTGQLATLIRAEKADQGSRFLAQNEKFSNNPVNKNKNLPPGATEPEQKNKKKRIRKKKDDQSNNQEEDD